MWNSWSKWLLCFNSQKCKVLDIGIVDSDSYEYCLGDARLEHTNEQKDLRVHIDNKLQFDTHISTKLTKANNMLGALRKRFSSYLKTPTLLCLYTSLVRPFIAYNKTLSGVQDLKFLSTISKMFFKKEPQKCYQS